MRVPSSLASAFGDEFESLISRFAVTQGLMPEPEAIRSRRFLSRSIVPHIEKLSSLFNREGSAQESGLDKYWKESSNPANLRLAYFLYFMPCNLFRVAAVWSELSRLGYRWGAGDRLKGIELGAGPASGACGIAAGERHSPVGLPSQGDWALIEQDRAMLELGASWAGAYFASRGIEDWGTRLFHRTLDFAKPLLPASAPKFNLWVMSYFLNEADLPADQLARNLLRAWDKHLEDEGLVILVEPALKLQSRRLLELRRELLEQQKDSPPAPALAALPGTSKLRGTRVARRLVPRRSDVVAPSLLPGARQDGRARPKEPAVQLPGFRQEQEAKRGTFAGARLERRISTPSVGEPGSCRRTRPGVLHLR